MSYHIQIGITTKLVVEKQEALQSFKDLEYIKDYVQRNFNSTNLYNVEEDESYIIWTLKKEIFDNEIVEFAKDFFSYLPDKHEFFDNKKDGYKKQMLTMLKQCTNTEQLLKELEVKHKKDANYFPYMKFMEHDEYIYKSKRMNYDAPTEFLQIATLGKGSETFFFSLFEKLLREKFSKYQIANALMLNQA